MEGADGGPEDLLCAGDVQVETEAQCWFNQVEVSQLFWWRGALYQRVDCGRDRWGGFNAVRIDADGLHYVVFGSRWRVRVA